jgi:ribosomal-protein-alanine acetyltransferase
VTAFRPATAADLDELMRLEHELFAGDAWSRDGMRSELASRHTVYLVLDGDGDAGGGDAGDGDAGAAPGGILAYGGVLAPRGADDADVQTIGVVERMRGRGLGRRLLRELLAAAAERGARRVFLEVRADNTAAQSLYRAFGFTEIGRRPRYYRPDGMDALVLRLDPLPSAAALREAVDQNPAGSTFPQRAGAEEGA